MDTGVRIYESHLNMFAYANDLNLVSTTAAGLQSLISYMNYTTSPKWTLGDSIIHLSKEANILGVTFNELMK